MAYDYDSLVAALTTYVEEDGDDNFTAMLPTIIGNAELRIYRDLDFLATRGQNSSLTFTTGSRTFSMAQMEGATIGGLPVAYAYPVVVQGISAIIPYTATPKTGQRVRFLPTTIDMIDNAWPNEATTGVPGTPFAWFTMLDYVTAIVAPTPNQPYPVEVTGTWRPAPMSASQEYSWLGNNLPDLLFKACMVEAVGYQQNFGATTDNPQMAVEWLAEYEKAKTNAMSEEFRRKWTGPAYQAFSPAPQATPVPPA